MAGGRTGAGTGASPRRNARAPPRTAAAGPAPPESTTPASRSTGSRLGVFSSARAAACGRRGEHRLDVVRPLAGLDGRGRRLADHRQHRALDRPRHGAVGGRRRHRERMGQVEAVETALAGEALGEAAHDLAQDHPGVAPRPEQGALAEAVGDRLHAGLVADVAQHLAAGRQHVRAGVAVRDGEDVEGVDLVDVRFEVRDGRPDRLQQPGARRRRVGPPTRCPRPPRRPPCRRIRPRPARPRLSGRCPIRTCRGCRTPAW